MVVPLVEYCTATSVNIMILFIALKKKNTFFFSFNISLVLSNVSDPEATLDGWQFVCCFSCRVHKRNPWICHSLFQSLRLVSMVT